MGVLRGRIKCACMLTDYFMKKHTLPQVSAPLGRNVLCSHFDKPTDRPVTLCFTWPASNQTKFIFNKRICWRESVRKCLFTFREAHGLLGLLGSIWGHCKVQAHREVWISLFVSVDPFTVWQDRTIEAAVTLWLVTGQDNWGWVTLSLCYLTADFPWARYICAKITSGSWFPKFRPKMPLYSEINFYYTD